MAPFTSSTAQPFRPFYTGTQRAERHVLLPPLEEAELRKSGPAEDESDSDKIEGSRSEMSESNGSLKSSEEALVVAFTKDLCHDMEHHGSLEGDRERMLSRLPILLKGFSIRLQNARLSPEQQNAAKFVKQHQE